MLRSGNETSERRPHMIEIRERLGKWHKIGCGQLLTDTNQCNCPQDIHLRHDVTTLTESQRNSRHLKRSLMSHLYWRLHFEYAIDEMNFIDVLGVRNNGYTAEYEVKVTKSDFDREVRIIKSTREQIYRYGKDWEKFVKHQLYLTKIMVEQRYANGKDRFIPNDFYFYVPDYLTQYAVSQLDGLPYGVVGIGKYIDGYGRAHTWRYTVHKKSVKLHKDKISPKLVSEIAHGLMARNIDLLKRIDVYETKGETTE